MKKYLSLAFVLSIIATFNGCRTVEIKTPLGQARNELDAREQWRYQLPSSEKKPLRPVFPKIQKTTLKNGIEILVVEDHRFPIAEVGIVLKNGSAKDTPGHAGLMQLTALMLKEGVSNMTSLELAGAFADLATEARVNVTKDMTQISAAVLSNKIGDVVSLLSMMVKEPRLEEIDFNRVKLHHQNQVAAQHGVLSYIAQVNFLKAAYGDKHPYATPIAGTLQTINNIHLSDIKTAHQENYGASIAALIVVGDATLAQLKALAKQRLGKWKKNASTLAKIVDPAPKKQMQTRLVSRDNSPQTYVLIGQPVATQNDKDLAKLEVFQNIIAGSPASRLDANLREGKGWTYGVSSVVNPLLGKGPLMVGSSIQTPFGSDALKEILEEFERLKKDPVTDEELNVAKNGLLFSFAGRYSTVGKIADVLAVQFVYSLPMKSDEIFYDQIAQVTKEDIQTVAKRVLKKENMVAVAVGDLEAMERPIAQMDVGKVVVEREEKAAQ